MSTTDEADERVRVELWVWADRDSLDDYHDLVLRRLEELDSTGVLDAFDIHEWPHQINLSSDESVDPEDFTARERVLQFADWAREEGVSLPFRDPQTAGSGRMGPEYVVLDLPRMMIAEYRDSELRCVAPFSENGTKHTIEERLDALVE